MISRIYWLLLLVLALANYILPHVAADRIDSCHRAKRSSSRVSERKCEEYSRGTTCKSSYDNIDPTAVEDAQRGEFPHLVFIAANQTQNEDFPFVCMGSLISPRFVMTAAHCTSSPSVTLSYVSLGNYNIKQTIQEKASTIQISIKAIHKHPAYQSSKKYNDIALLELVSDVPFTANIRPACLWMEHQLSGHDKALIATMDRTSDLELRADVIQKVSVTIKDDAACNSSSWINRRWPHGIDVTQLCGKEATGSNPHCKAVGGAPLQIVSNEKDGCAFRIIGLASFGSLTCTELPTVFTRISSYVDWIESIVWPTA